MPSETLQISIMKTVLTNIFGTINGMFVTEDKICSAYENEMGKLLEDDLRPLKMDLQEFIKRYFYEEFTIIPDPTQRSYMRRQDYLSQISARPAITAPTESNNGIPTGFDSAPTAPASQHNGSGRDHSASQSRQSSLHSTPTPPPASFQPAPTRPAVPLSSFQDAPPGFSQPRQEVVTQRSEKLQKQFSDLGLEDKRIDHQPKTVPNIEELETTPSPSHADEHLETDDFLDEGTHGIVESPHGSVCDESHEQSVPPKSNEDFGLSRQDFPPLNVKVEPKQKCVPPPPGFDGIKSALRDQSNELNCPERPVEGSRKVHIKTEIPFEVSLEDPRFPASFKKHLSPFKRKLQISQTKLFYNIVQGSITNSMDVNGYRDSLSKAFGGY
ncbi:hypothetical protein M3Y97_00459700 [Aphelenchoides bicaudatus]|nr:hypothetical protein M3Y97_00459700 [Aphelenchoides bicaudatus]